jgi:hypothetical protein
MAWLACEHVCSGEVVDPGSDRLLPLPVHQIRADEPPPRSARARWDWRGRCWPDSTGNGCNGWLIPKASQLLPPYRWMQHVLSSDVPSLTLIADWTAKTYGINLE